MFKNLLASVMVCVLMIAGVLYAYDSWAGDKTGFVNLRRLVMESAAGRDARAGLEELRAQKEEVIQQSLMELTRLRTRIVTEEKNLGQEELQQKREALEKKVREHNRLVDDIKEELTRRENDLTAEILKLADQALKRVASKSGYNVILKDPNVIGYLSPEADVTDKVLKELNAGK